MKQNTYIGVIGGRECSKQQARFAFEVGSLIAREGWILICGGMGGVMEMACRGAQQNQGVTIGILPGNAREESNPWLSYSIVTGLGEARNSLVVKSCQAVIAVAGSFGTLSEMAFAGILGVPVVGLDTWVIDPEVNGGARVCTYKAENPGQAIEYVKQLLSIS